MHEIQITGTSHEYLLPFGPDLYLSNSFLMAETSPVFTACKNSLSFPISNEVSVNKFHARVACLSHWYYITVALFATARHVNKENKIIVNLCLLLLLCSLLVAVTSHDRAHQQSHSIARGIQQTSFSLTQNSYLGFYDLFLSCFQ